MNNKRILIIGSSGMLGMDLSARLAGQYDLICTDIIEKNNPPRSSKKFIKCDITDRDQIVDVIKESKPDLIVHAAAWTDVDGCELDSEKAFKINSQGTVNVALGAKETKATIVYISSDFVFDGEKDEPYKEDDAPNPINIYGASKLEGEKAVSSETDRYIILRTSWLFGKNGKNFVDIILSLAQNDKELKIVVDQFGSPTYVKDLSMALMNLITKAFSDQKTYGIYHFSNSGSCSWYKYAEEIIRLANKRGIIIIPITSMELDRPAKRPKMSILNTEKYSKFCNDRPRNWQTVLEEYLIEKRREEENRNVQNIRK